MKKLYRSEPPINVVGFRHTGLIVSDLEAALNFYNNFLGLEIIQEHVDDSEYISKITSIPNLTVKYAKLRVPDGTVIELLTYPTHIIPRVARQIHAPGEAHLALQVQSIDDTFKKVKASDVKYLSEPVLSSEGIAKVFFVLDPDDYRIEFVEMVPLRIRNQIE